MRLELSGAPGIAARHETESSRPPVGGDDGFEQFLAARLRPADEARLDPAWQQVQRLIRELALRPAKRLRPRLLRLGYDVAGVTEAPSEALNHFGAGLEVLHTFLLIHDDVADRSPLRRGGPTLHRTLDRFGAGEDLAVVAGNHLFALAIELLLTTPMPEAAAATLYYLGICRHTAAGQYLDLVFSKKPLSEMTPFDALKVAHLKTANYSFAAPLACGAMLARAPRSLAASLERVGRLGGLAYQLRDDLLGIVGDPAVSGKPDDGDLAEGKRTFPLLVAYRNASAAEREVLDALGSGVDPALVDRARDIISSNGGVTATERAIERHTRAALRAIRLLPASLERTEGLTRLVTQLATRSQ